MTQRLDAEGGREPPERLRWVEARLKRGIEEVDLRERVDRKLLGRRVSAIEGEHDGVSQPGEDPEPPAWPDLATPALVVLAEGPLAARALARRLRVPMERVVNLLESLYWHGDVLQLEDGRFVTASAVGVDALSEPLGGVTARAALSGEA